MAASPETLAYIHGTLIGEALEHGPVGVFVFDDEGRYVAVNQKACELLGYDRAELLELRIGDLAVQAREEAIAGYLAAVRERRRGAVVARRKDGSEVGLCFLAQETHAAGLPFFVAVAWPADD